MRKESHTERLDRSHQENVWGNWTAFPQANTIYSNNTYVLFVSTYTKEIIKGTLVNEFRTSGDPLCAFRSVQNTLTLKLFK